MTNPRYTLDVLGCAGQSLGVHVQKPTRPFLAVADDLAGGTARIRAIPNPTQRLPVGQQYQWALQLVRRSDGIEQGIEHPGRPRGIGVIRDAHHVSDVHRPCAADERPGDLIGI